MASIRKKEKKWIAEVRTKGIYRSKIFPTRMEAQTWALDLERQLGKHPGLVTAHSLREAMQRYAKEVSPSKKGARWEVVRLQKLERDPIADIMLCDLRREDIQGWIGRQTISAASINRELNVIGAVLREARIQWKWMAENPMQDVKRPKGSAPRDRLIKDAELERLLLALEYDENSPVTTMRQEIAVAFLFPTSALFEGQ